MSYQEFRFCPRCGQQLEWRSLEGRSRQVCPACGWIVYENPLPCAAALVRNERGEILLVKRGVEPAKGEWALPSGFMEIDETPEECCLRELEEETGLKGKILRLVGVYAQTSALYKKVLIIGYEVEAPGEPVPGSDSQAVAFFLPERMPPVAFSSHRQLIQDLLIIEKDK
ncbi:MAG: NUDIX hydrolase [Candidatus Aminicenantes bacterium]|nr:NUDIX hydrolase [Candidatus Aminicenantes bacterium]